jgi:DNA-binding LacI/PurR family transcriptional regulator
MIGAGMADRAARSGGNGRATLRDVADRAGVSPQTVSNYLNGRHVTRAATRERVDRAIRELGYRPNAAARALRSQRARAIAFLLEDPNDQGLHEPLHTEFLHGVAAAAHAADYHLSIALTAPGETFSQAQRLVREGRADGLILSLGGLDAERDAIRRLTSEGVPVVLLQQWLSLRDVFTVSAQDEEGAEQVADHLIDLGHRRLAWVCGRPLWPGPRRRRDGFVRAATARGAEVVEWTCDAYTVPSARALLAAELRGDGRPTGILAANDLIALGLVQQALEMGIDVPGDLSIVGYNDFDFASWVQPSITTVRIPGAGMGARAVDLLVSAIEDSRPPESVAFQAELVLRHTTAPAAS